MPITYPRSLAHPSYLAHVSDADESIVLSDLVRSGEVSRLRRRGAIAIRDMNVPQSPVPLTLNAPPTSGTSRPSSVSLPPVAQPNPEPDLSETDEDDAEQRQGGVGRWFFRSRLNLRELSTSDLNDPDPSLFPQEFDVHLEDDDSNPSYVLFCGGRLRESEWYSPPNSPRPRDPPTRHRASAFRAPTPSCRSSFPRARRTNGCGVLIHLNAQPRRRQGTWVACGAAAETVVRMAARYFDCYSTVRMIKSACGCVREGVGCRVCGNPLGIIYLPCQAAADGLNVSRAPSSSSQSSTSRTEQPAQTPIHIQPPGPCYWMPGVGACQRRRHTASPEIFNFFSERVRSAPEFTFPPLPPEELSSRTMRPLSPGSLATPSRRLSASSMADAYAFRQWTDRSPMPSVDSLQASDPLWDNQPGEDSRAVGNTSQEDEAEGDNAEKPEDRVPSSGGQILWAER